ncbi:MAG TPA: glycosyltransferase family A protein, partial [Xanthobacteraceae bacterium]|nr:glycosyltransferase family A protein [Xanthobacteraceae bacterium]
MDTPAGRNLISVIVPAYNAGRYIGRCLASAGGQTYRDIEVIVVDDGSTDDTVERVREAMVADPRVHLVQTDRGGVSRARNLAIARARGDLIAPLDADDLWTRDKLERQLALLSKASINTGVVYCGAAGIDDL